MAENTSTASAVPLDQGLVEVPITHPGQVFADALVDHDSIMVRRDLSTLLGGVQRRAVLVVEAGHAHVRGVGRDLNVGTERDDGVLVQAAVQPSPSTSLPSSQVSPSSMAPLPQQSEMGTVMHPCSRSQTPSPQRPQARRASRVGRG